MHTRTCLHVLLLCNGHNLASLELSVCCLLCPEVALQPQLCTLMEYQEIYISPFQKAHIQDKKYGVTSLCKKRNIFYYTISDNISELKISM